jgi:hypothetical protein
VSSGTTTGDAVVGQCGVRHFFLAAWRLDKPAEEGNVVSLSSTT